MKTLFTILLLIPIVYQGLMLIAGLMHTMYHSEGKTPQKKTGEEQ